VQLILDLFEPLPPRFDHFEPTGNEALVELLRGFAQGKLLAGVTTPHLSLWGPSGSGKSHLLQAVAALAAELGFPVYYRSCGTPSMVLPAEPEALIALDQLDAASEAEQGQLFSAFNLAGERNQRWLVASSLPPAHLPLRDDLRTRLALLPTFRVEPLDDRGRRALLHRRAAALGVTLSQAAADYLLHHAPREIPALLLILEAAAEESLRLKRPMTPALIRQVWQLLSQG
jgi:DnaA family protein